MNNLYVMMSRATTAEPGGAGGRPMKSDDSRGGTSPRASPRDVARATTQPALSHGELVSFKEWFIFAVQQYENLQEYNCIIQADRSFDEAMTVACSICNESIELADGNKEREEEVLSDFQWAVEYHNNEREKKRARLWRESRLGN